MLINDEFIENIKTLLDGYERMIRRKLVMEKMLEQHGMKNVGQIVEQNLNRPDIQAVSNQELSLFQSLRSRMLRTLEGGDPDAGLPLPTGKPN